MILAAVPNSCSSLLQGGPIALVARKRARRAEVDVGADQTGALPGGVRLRWVRRRSARGSDGSEEIEELEEGEEDFGDRRGKLVLESFELVPMPAQPQPDAELFCAAANLLASIAAVPLASVVVTATVPLVQCTGGSHGG